MLMRCRPWSIDVTEYMYIHSSSACKEVVIVRLFVSQRCDYWDCGKCFCCASWKFFIHLHVQIKKEAINFLNIYWLCFYSLVPVQFLPNATTCVCMVGAYICITCYVKVKFLPYCQFWLVFMTWNMPWLLDCSAFMDFCCLFLLILLCFFLWAYYPLLWVLQNSLSVSSS